MDCLLVEPASLGLFLVWQKGFVKPRPAQQLSAAPARRYTTRNVEVTIW